MIAKIVTTSGPQNIEDEESIPRFGYKYGLSGFKLDRLIQSQKRLGLLTLQCQEENNTGLSLLGKLQEIGVRWAEVPVVRVKLVQKLLSEKQKALAEHLFGKVIIFWHLSFELFGEKWVYYFDTVNNNLGFISLSEPFPPHFSTLIALS